VRSCAGPEGLDHLDPSGSVTARVVLPNVDGLAAAAGSLWAISHDGTLTQIDATSGRVRRRWPGLAPLANPSSADVHVLAADRSDVWVLSTGRAAILRVERGRVVRRLPVDESTRPLLASAGDGLWVATADRSGGHNRLVRLDPRTGTPTATLELGLRRPVALIPSSGELSVVTGTGRILFVGS
jgi:hypothetical protein